MQEHLHHPAREILKRSVILTLFILCLNGLLEAHPGIGIVMDSQGNVFYTDLVQVWKISPNGDRSIAVKDVHTHELFLDDHDNLYGEHEWYKGEASDKWGNYVWRLSPEGVIDKVIPDVEGFLDNTTLIRDTEGNSYWARKSGENEMLMKQLTSGQQAIFSYHAFTDIRWMHFSRDGQCLYVVDLLTLKKVDESGKVSIVSDDLKEEGPSFEDVHDRHYFFGIWTDKAQSLYVAAYGAGKVKKIDAGGQITTVFTSEEGWSPCGGPVAPDDSIWIMEFSKNNQTRIRKINSSGEEQVYGG